MMINNSDIIYLVKRGQLDSGIKPRPDSPAGASVAADASGARPGGDTKSAPASTKPSPPAGPTSTGTKTTDSSASATNVDKNLAQPPSAVGVPQKEPAVVMPKPAAPAEIRYPLAHADVVNIMSDIQSKMNSVIGSSPNKFKQSPSEVLDEVYSHYKQEFDSAKDPADQARAAFAMASINIARNYQQSGVLPDFHKLTLALDTNDDKYLDMAEIRAIYNNVASQTPGMPKLLRPEGFGAWFADFMDQLNTTQKVLLAVGVPLGAIGLLSALIRGPDAGNIIMGIGGIGATIAAFTAAGLMPGSRTFNISQLPSAGSDYVSQVIDKRLAEAIHLLRSTATDTGLEDLNYWFGLNIPKKHHRYITDTDAERATKLWRRIANRETLSEMFGTTKADLYNAVRAINNMDYVSPSDVITLSKALEGLCYVANESRDKNIEQYIKYYKLPPLKPRTDDHNILKEEMKSYLSDAGNNPANAITQFARDYGIPASRILNDAAAALRDRIPPK